jgi:hypothetical protein
VAGDVLGVAWQGLPLESSCSDPALRELRDMADNRIAALLKILVDRGDGEGGAMLASFASGRLIELFQDSVAVRTALEPSRWYRFLDSVLLDVLDRDPHQIERTFARLFLGNPADRVLRFLDECSPPSEQLRLIATLPKAPYVHSVARRALRRW